MYKPSRLVSFKGISGFIPRTLGHSLLSTSKQRHRVNGSLTGVPGAGAVAAVQLYQKCPKPGEGGASEKFESCGCEGLFYNVEVEVLENYSPGRFELN